MFLHSQRPKYAKACRHALEVVENQVVIAEVEQGGSEAARRERFVQVARRSQDASDDDDHQQRGHEPNGPTQVEIFQVQVRRVAIFRPQQPRDEIPAHRKKNRYA